MAEGLSHDWGGADPAPSAAFDKADGQSIRFEDVSVRYGSTTVLSDLNLSVAAGEIMALLGPSGSGKTTALRAVAGFVTPTRGRVFVGGRDVTHVAPHARNLGMVVQNYALFPHMTVAENVAFGLRARRADRALIATRVEESLSMVGMGPYAARIPRALSGGQQQRVAIARALAIRPSVLLLDEPLSALDAQIRRQMVEEIGRLHAELPDLTILYVTHDQHEALSLADRIAIMRDGRLAALDTARTLFRRPPNRFSAEFLGRANVLAGRVEAVSEDGSVAEMIVEGQRLRGANIHGLAQGASALVCIRPHQLTMTAGAGAEHVRGRIAHVDWQGASETLTIRFGAGTLLVTAVPSSVPHRIGEDLSVYYDPSDATILPAEPSDG
ncbi:MAG: ABC transporter ATP-binding protein [Paracoccaceae bacterium]|nr:ABC transporter ATP-binding protein [Paracoccaceae bacterium]